MSKAREIMKNNKAKTGYISVIGNWTKKLFTSVSTQGMMWGSFVSFLVVILVAFSFAVLDVGDSSC